MKKVIVDVPSELCIDDGQCDEIGVKSERNKEKKKGLNSDNWIIFGKTDWSLALRIEKPSQNYITSLSS